MSTPIDQSLAAALVSERRVELGLTQMELAIYGGVSLATLQNIEAGVRRKRSEALERVVRALDSAEQVASGLSEEGKRRLADVLLSR